MAQGLRREIAVIDASVLFALTDADQAAHEACRRALEEVPAIRLFVSPFALAEADYLLLDRLGTDAEIALLHDVERGAYRLLAFDADDVAACLPILEKYSDLEIGLADASTVLLAHRLKTRLIFTLDRRHFEAMRPLSGGRFDLLPR